jgi:parvulin-like peptidyl-prolyl isomerase
MKLLREPLLHFAIAGALLFGAYAWLNRGKADPAGAGRTVRITEQEVNWIVETAKRQWSRAPTESELHTLVAEYLREELLSREARELELDRDDTIVRRRLAQKMTFYLEDTARQLAPPEAELRALYDAERESYSEPAQASFVQVYFSREKHGERTVDEARKTLAKLAREGERADPAQLGDPSLLPGALADADQRAISSSFGDDFANAVLALAPGAWHGPIESSYGVHLVRVTARREPKARPYESVREDLVAEWRRGREEKAKSDYFAGLLRKYDVQVSPAVRPLLGPTLSALEGKAP